MTSPHKISAKPALHGGALSGVRVLDLSRVLAGPWATQLLGDFGADVIKVERPGAGDDTRTWGPPYLKDGDGRDTTDAAYYLCANRNKRSVTIDIAPPEGQALVRGLAAKADVLVENFKLGGLEAVRPRLRKPAAINPRLVYCSVTGFGQTGPYAPRAGYDFLMQGMGGLMSITGHADGEAGRRPAEGGRGADRHDDRPVRDDRHPRRAGRAANARAAASTSTWRCSTCRSPAWPTRRRTTSPAAVVPRRMGNAHPNIVPYQDFPTADGDMILAIGNDGQFAKFCAVAGPPEWAGDERFATNPRGLPTARRWCRCCAKRR